MGIYYLVGYDLKHGSEADYADLINALKKIGTDWWHCLDSTWFIVHPGPPLAICTALTKHMHRTDQPGKVRLTPDVMMCVDERAHAALLVPSDNRCDTIAALDPPSTRSSTKRCIAIKASV